MPSLLLINLSEHTISIIFDLCNIEYSKMKGNKPSKKKIPYPVTKNLEDYLTKYNRKVTLPIQYEDMLCYEAGIPLINRAGQDTHWKSVVYQEYDKKQIYGELCEVYALLKTDGDTSVIEHLTVDRVDYCVFGNTHPFRVRIINNLNDNYDHFYIKTIDASRIYGLELEELLSPNNVTYLIDRETLVEEHIAGIPGDDFMENNLNVTEFDEIRIAKEFIKFNERCFIRLLGDMRSYNYIIDITPDIEGAQYRIRAIDFDQQSYEGRKSFYLPQYFKENNPIIEMGLKHLSPKTVKQYQLEERSLISRRIKMSRSRIVQLINCMRKEKLSSTKKIIQLREELAYHHKHDSFLACETMGEIVLNNLKLLLQKEFIQGIIS